MSDDKPRVQLTRYYGYNYEDNTTVYTRRSSSKVFHADEYCPHLLGSAEYSHYHDEETVHLNAHPLPKVMSSYLNPVKPCDYCTQDIETTVEVVTEHDGMDECHLQYFEPGDQRVTRTVRTHDDGSTTVRESATEVY